MKHACRCAKIELSTFNPSRRGTVTERDDLKVGEAMILRGMSDNEIDSINAEIRRQFHSEAGLCMVASEGVLRKEWENPEEDAAWEGFMESVNEYRREGNNEA